MKSFAEYCLLLLVSAGLASCLKPETYSQIPAIDYVSFEQTGDTAYLTISFTDGDGDIGLKQEESLPPYQYNLFINYYEKVNGVWVQGLTVPAGTPIQYNYRTQYLVPEGKNKALKGKIRVKMIYYYNPLSSDSDTIKYDIQLSDRALHMSNKVETPEFIR